MTAAAPAVHLGEKRRSAVAGTTLSSHVVVRAIQDSFIKLDPRKLSPANPVILAVWIVALLATVSTVDDFRTGADPWWAFQIALWLWFYRGVRQLPPRASPRWPRQVAAGLQASAGRCEGRS